MKRVKVWVIARHDSADDLAIAFCQEQCRVAVSIERMTLSIEKRFTFDQQRGHPGGIVAIDFPWKFDEDIAVFP